MALLLSVDLAYKHYRNFGFCLLKESAGKVIDIRYLPFHSFGHEGIPCAAIFTDRILNYCLDRNVSILMLDGPQGWKNPDNGLTHQRICEKQLHTQAKTGTFGEVKPANFKPFISFATEVFSLLYKTGRASLVTEPGIAVSPGSILLVETYPYSAWRRLGMLPLPSKRKCTQEQLAWHAESLKRHCALPDTGNPTHDELSALVAGLAGVAIAAGNKAGYAAVGIPPTISPDEYILEGYIVVPSQE